MSKKFNLRRGGDSKRLTRREARELARLQQSMDSSLNALISVDKQLQEKGGYR